MGALFPAWSDTAFRLGLCLLTGGAVTGVTFPMIYARTPYNQGRDNPVVQPVAFDHRHHVKDDGIDCRYCHGEAETAPDAGMPATEVCMGCHAQIWERSSLLEPVRASYFTGQPVRWRRVHDLPDFVYFDHSVHVQGGVGCVTCHGRVDQMAMVYQTAPLTMGWCLDCHRDPQPHRRPLAEVTSMTWSGGGAPPPIIAHARPGRAVNSLTTCTTCHR
ncbi:MAG TPA: cytochrome c3 family protein [Polyangia bacterium]|jgi:hypothetical protein